MRADRLLSIVLLLQVHQRMTSRTLAQRLEVSERTIHRDMDALSRAGIPVVADRGINGGWSLLGHYKTSLTGLTQSEIESLFVTKPAKLLEDLRLDTAAEGAFLKLLAAMPAAHRADAELASKRIYVDLSGWSQTSEPIPFLPVLQQALWQQRQAEITYNRGPNCDSVKRLLSPLGLVAKGSAWYLVAFVDDALRSYRVSRITEARITEHESIKPPDFNLASYWEQSKQTFKSQLPNYRARFRVSPGAFLRLRFAGRFARVGEAGIADDHGWREVEVGFDVMEMACEYALSFGNQLEVLAPEGLRNRVIAAALAVLDFYDRSEAVSAGFSESAKQC